MTYRGMSVGVVATLFGGIAGAQGQQHLNPMVELHQLKQPVFGLYAPSNPRGRGGRGGPPGAVAVSAQPAPPPAPQKSPTELAKDALAYAMSDFIFDGGMEGDFDRGFASFSQLVTGLADAAPPAVRMRHPLVVKTHKISENVSLAQERIGKQLNLGVNTIVFVETESVEEVKAGLAAMRFKSNGGVRPDEVGGAPAYWGVEIGRAHV